jgi:hypothetical protein
LKKLVLALVVALVAAPSAFAARTIYVQDTSSKVSEAEVENDMVAFTAALGDFGSIWGKQHGHGVRTAGVELRFVPAEVYVPSNAWLMTVTDQPDCWGCYGFHDFNKRIRPAPYAEVGTDGNWTITFTHELFEMVADPLINRFHAVGQRKYLIEAADPVEDDSFAYTINWPLGNSVLISDFPTPNWYRPGSAPPYDFKGYVSKPLELLCGGYVSWLEDGSWGQAFAPDC